MQLLFAKLSKISSFANCLFAFAVLFAGFSSLNVANAGALHRLRFDHFSIDQGLPSTGIMTVYQTRNGFVWMGTANGLVRYDGRHIRLFSHLPVVENTLNHDRIFSLFEDDQQRLWVGTRRGLNLFDLRTDQIQRIPMPTTMDSKKQIVYAISQASEGRLWLATASGLMLFDPASKKFTTWQADASRRTDFEGEIRALLSDKTGGVWIGQGQTVAHINDRGQLVHHLNTTQAHLGKNLQASQAQVRSLAFDSQGQLWVGMTGGLRIWRIEQDQMSAVALPPSLTVPDVTVAAILQDHEQSMWLGLGADRGLLRWRADQNHVDVFVNRPSVNSSLSGDSITSLMQDASGGLWVGTSDYGANLVDLKGRSFTTYLNIPGDDRSLSNRLVTAVIPDRKDYVWLGTLGGGLNRLHLPSGDTQRFNKKQVGVEYIRALMVDQKDRLWVGGWRAIANF